MRKVLHLTAVLSATLAAVVPGVALSQSQTQTTPNSGTFQGVPTNGASIVPPTTTDGGVGTGQAVPANGQAQPVQLTPNTGTNPTGTSNTSNNGVLDNRNGSNTSNTGVVDNRNGSNTSNNGVLDNDRNPTPNNSINNGVPASGTVLNQGVPANASPNAVQIAPSTTGTGVNQGVPSGTVINPGQTVQPGTVQGVPATTGTSVNQGVPSGTVINPGQTAQPGTIQGIPANIPVTAQPGAVISPNLRPNGNRGAATNRTGIPRNSQVGTGQAPAVGTTANPQSAPSGTSTARPTSTIASGQVAADTLDDDLARATCNQNWQQAIRIVNQALAAAPANQTAYRAQLQQYRSRLQSLQRADVQVPGWSNQCQ
jgi:hypothetical protein